MDWFIRNHKWLVGFALLFGVFAYWAGFKLLNEGLLTGSEFVTLLIAATVVSLVVVFAPFIQEVSIGGSVIKLKEAKLEADESLKTLNDARVSILVAAIGTLRRSVLSTEERLLYADDRIGNFLALYQSNKDLLTHPQVRAAVKAGAGYFLQECEGHISRNLHIHDEGLGGRPEPEALEQWYRKKKNLNKAQPEYPQTIKEYRSLFELFNSLEHI